MKHVFFNFQVVPAPVAVLAFLGLGLAEIVAVGAAVVLLARRRARLAKVALAGALEAAAIYAAVLLGRSAVSRERVAAPGEEKYFCEVDCHLAYSVVGVERAKTLGIGADRATAGGEYRVVELRVRFDEETIARWRPEGMSLEPNPRAVEIVDAAGHAYPPDAAGQRALASTEGPAIPLTRPLLPGQSYATRLVFDLPEEARDPRLLLRESDWVTHLLIGHENSFFHGKTSFRL